VGARLRIETGLMKALRSGVAVCAVVLATAGAVAAQGFSEAESPFPTETSGNLLLTANELVYNFDTQRVVARGAVQIDYSGFNMVADRVEYDQQNGRLYAFGNIELVEPDGNRIYADELDLTDDFADGFVNALRIETPDNTRIVADSAERVSGTETALNNGVYTACEVCAENPDKAPLWQVKARRVVQNGDSQTIRLEGASFELFGRPIAYLPFLVVPDHTVRRQSGFLAPTLSFNDELGLGVRVPYYFALSPHMDATVSVTGYSNQGFLAEGEFRQRFVNGFHTLRVAGISQLSPEDFDARTADRLEVERGLISSTAQFEINPRWVFGWDLTAQSDNNFGRRYNIEGFEGANETSSIYLTGLNDRNFFDLRGHYFHIQDGFQTSLAERQQAIVLPSLDYAYTADEPIYGGELSFDVNATRIDRRRTALEVSGLEPFTNRRIRGVSGENTRLTSEAEWRRTVIGPGGLVITPLLAARGDAHFLDVDLPSGYGGTANVTNGSETRTMVTAGLETRYPVVVSTPNTSHIFEPVAQVFLRPDERLAGGLPNEDAQSFVFDASTLFERDKFSGYDRIEGGTRANVGLRYTGSFQNGIGVNAVAGQSFHLAGINSFASPDFVNAGADSGLETAASDYVGQVGVTMPGGISFTGSARFDDKSLDLQRTDIDSRYANETVALGLGYSQIAAQPDYRSAGPSKEVRGNATLQFAENWNVFGAAAYDIEEDAFTRTGIGLGYADECFTFTIAYTEARSSTPGSNTDWGVQASLSFRTLGDFNFGSQAFAD
jgi:LPS-assembly protein